jgi:hypothetical protein
MSDASKFDLRGANIGNLADTVHGKQVATQHINAQYIDASEQNFEFLLTDFQQFISSTSYNKSILMLLMKRRFKSLMLKSKNFDENSLCAGKTFSI